MRYELPVPVPMLMPLPMSRRHVGSPSRAEATKRSWVNGAGLKVVQMSLLHGRPLDGFWSAATPRR